ncbi:transposase [Bradyrhizobium liaoningense]
MVSTSFMVDTSSHPRAQLHRCVERSAYDWLRKRIRSGPFTLRKLTQELAARGIKTDVRAVWTFVHAEGLSFKKNASTSRAGSPRRRP